MNYYLKLLLFAVIIAVYTGATGCSNDRKSNPPQEQYSQEQKAQEQNSQEQKRSKNAKLDAPIISQKPELKSGCEITSLAMLLQYAGVQVDKMTLAQKIRKDSTPIELNEKKNVKKWGDPNEGFVGDITGKERGFAVYPKPMVELMEQYMPGRAVDLTNQPFEALLKSIDQKRPVILWVTIDFKLPDKFEQWEKDGKIIKATLDEHAVLLVGYDENNCYVNDPYDGKKNKEVKKDMLINSWKSIGSMAISYK